METTDIIGQLAVDHEPIKYERIGNICAMLHKNSLKTLFADLEYLAETMLDYDDFIDFFDILLYDGNDRLRTLERNELIRFIEQICDKPLDLRLGFTHHSIGNIMFFVEKHVLDYVDYDFKLVNDIYVLDYVKQHVHPNIAHELVKATKHNAKFMFDKMA